MPKKIEVDIGELLEMLGRGWSETEAAKYFRCDRRTIANRLRELDIHMGRSGPGAANWKGGVKLDSDGYVRLLRPEHPRADANGYVPRGILNWEEKNGPWPKGADMHHLHEPKTDDRAKNIEPKTHPEHSREHSREQVRYRVRDARGRFVKGQKGGDSSGEKQGVDKGTIKAEKEENGNAGQEEVQDHSHGHPRPAGPGGFGAHRGDGGAA